MKGRVFTAEFRLKIVRHVLAGVAAFTTLTGRATTPETSEAQELRELQNRVAELERSIGEPCVELYFKKVAELLFTPSSNASSP